MNTTELKALATAGVAVRIQQIEKELATYHREWPDLFLSPTAPQLLKAEPKANGNGHFPKITATQKKKGAWTDERRAKFAATMKKKRGGGKKQRYTKFGSEEHRAKMAASWTPERRAKMARLMKKRMKAIHAAKRSKAMHAAKAALRA